MPRIHPRWPRPGSVPHKIMRPPAAVISRFLDPLRPLRDTAPNAFGRTRRVL